MEQRRSYVTSDIDFERDGKQISVFRLPYSRNTSGWGIIPIPIAVIRNGEGPTVLFTAGNHGDEYEGQIALNWLLRDLQPADIRGRVIILPAMNYPAAMVGRRVSPIDGLNLNRVFPGDPDGSPTQQIAHYVSTVLLPLADAAMDLHSGGYSMDAVPTVIMYRAKSEATMAKIIGAGEVFGCPLGVVMDDLGERRTIDAICRDRGLIKLGTELAGGGSVSFEVVRMARAGLWRVLRYFGVLTNEAKIPSDPSSTLNHGKMRLMEITGPESYVYATGDAIFEPNYVLGSEVNKGQIAGWLHYIDEITRDPQPLTFQKSGLVFCKRGPGRVMPGDVVAVVVSDAR